MTSSDDVAFFMATATVSCGRERRSAASVGGAYAPVAFCRGKPIVQRWPLVTVKNFSFLFFSSSSSSSSFSLGEGREEDLFCYNCIVVYVSDCEM